jgi:hypothetical protein
MKKYVFLLVLVVAIGFFSCNSGKTKTGGEYNIDNPANADDPDANNDGLPTIDLDETEYNFGTVIQGEKVSHSFVFTNNGDGNLVISNVKASCGCTVPKWTKEPIMPGGTSVIDVKYATNRIGPINKSVTISSNAVNKLQISSGLNPFSNLFNAISSMYFIIRLLSPLLTTANKNSYKLLR